MIKTDLHTHTVYCDGNNTPEEMILSALGKGFDCIGFSGHSYTFFDERYCMSKSGTLLYRDEIASLKKKYRGRINVLCGIEQDYYSEEKADGYDYVIGSVHFLKMGDDYLPIDNTLEIQKESIAKYFGGDSLAYAEKYFETVADVYDKTKANIIGHFDLLTKFCDVEKIFDRDHPRYINAWKNAADRLLKTPVIFEINTGAISRGYRKDPYPDYQIIKYIKNNGGRFILSGDGHSTDAIGFSFSDFEYLL